MECLVFAGDRTIEMKLAGKGKATGDNDKRIPCILKGQTLDDVSNWVFYPLNPIANTGRAERSSSEGQTLDDVSNWVFYPLNPIANILHKIKCQSRNQIF